MKFHHCCLMLPQKDTARYSRWRLRSRFPATLYLSLESFACCISYLPFCVSVSIYLSLTFPLFHLLPFFSRHICHFTGLLDFKFLCFISLSTAFSYLHVDHAVHSLPVTKPLFAQAISYLVYVLRAHIISTCCVRSFQNILCYWHFFLITSFLTLSSSSA